MINNLIQLSRNKFLNFPFQSQWNKGSVHYLNYTNSIIINVLIFVGTLTNLFLTIVYITKKRKFIDKYYMPLYLLANQVTLFTFFLSNAHISSNEITFLEYSRYSCKFTTFTFHIASATINWIHAIYPLLLKYHITNSVVAMNRVQIALYILPLALGAVYSVDLVYLELTFNEYANTTNEFRQILCQTQNSNSSLVKDFVDTIFYFIIPYMMLLFNACSFKSADKTMTKIKFTVPTIFLLVWSPVCFVVILRDFQIISNTPFKNGDSLNVWFSAALIINQCLPAIASCIHSFVNHHNRKVFRYMLCLLCWIRDHRAKKRKSAQRLNLNRKRTRSFRKNMRIDEIRRTFYFNYFKNRSNTTNF